MCSDTYLSLCYSVKQEGFSMKITRRSFLGLVATSITAVAVTSPVSAMSLIKPPVTELEKIVSDAIKRGVSDIHLEYRPSKSVITVRFRRFRGALETRPSMSVRALNTLLHHDLGVTVGKKESHTHGAERFFLNGERFHCRWANMPCFGGGYDLVMRVIKVHTPLTAFG